MDVIGLVLYILGALLAFLVFVRVGKYLRRSIPTWAMFRRIFGDKYHSGRYG